MDATTIASNQNSNFRKSSKTATFEMNCNEGEMTFDRQVIEANYEKYNHNVISAPPPEELEIAEITNRMTRPSLEGREAGVELRSSENYLHDHDAATSVSIHPSPRPRGPPYPHANIHGRADLVHLSANAAASASSVLSPTQQLHQQQHDPAINIGFQQHQLHIPRTLSRTPIHLQSTRTHEVVPSHAHRQAPLHVPSGAQPPPPAPLNAPATARHGDAPVVLSMGAPSALHVPRTVGAPDVASLSLPMSPQPSRSVKMSQGLSSPLHIKSKTESPNPGRFHVELVRSRTAESPKVDTPIVHSPVVGAVRPPPRRRATSVPERRREEGVGGADADDSAAEEATVDARHVDARALDVVSLDARDDYNKIARATHARSSSAERFVDETSESNSRFDAGLKSSSSVETSLSNVPSTISAPPDSSPFKQEFTGTTSTSRDAKNDSEGGGNYAVRTSDPASSGPEFTDFVTGNIPAEYAGIFGRTPGDGSTKDTEPRKPPRKFASVPPPSSPSMPRALQRLVGANQPVQLPVPIPVSGDNAAASGRKTLMPSEIAASKKASLYQGKLFRKIQKMTSTEDDQDSRASSTASSISNASSSSSYSSSSSSSSIVSVKRKSPSPEYKNQVLTNDRGASPSRPFSPGRSLSPSESLNSRRSLSPTGAISPESQRVGQPPIIFPRHNSSKPMDHFELNKLMHPLPNEAHFPAPASDASTNDPVLSLDADALAAQLRNPPEAEPFAEGDLGTDPTLKPRWTVGGATPAFISKNFQPPPNFGSAKAINNNRFSVSGLLSPSPFRRMGRSSSVSRVEDSPPMSPPMHQMQPLQQQQLPRLPPFNPRPKKFIKQSKLEKMLYETYVRKPGKENLTTSKIQENLPVDFQQQPQQQQQPQLQQLKPKETNSQQQQELSHNFNQQEPKEEKGTQQQPPPQTQPRQTMRMMSEPPRAKSPAIPGEKLTVTFAEAPCIINYTRDDSADDDDDDDTIFNDPLPPTPPATAAPLKPNLIPKHSNATQGQEEVVAKEFHFDQDHLHIREESLQSTAQEESHRQPHPVAVADEEEPAQHLQEQQSWELHQQRLKMQQEEERRRKKAADEERRSREEEEKLRLHVEEVKKKQEEEETRVREEMRMEEMRREEEERRKEEERKEEERRKEEKRKEDKRKEEEKRKEEKRKDEEKIKEAERKRREEIKKALQLNREKARKDAEKTEDARKNNEENRRVEEELKKQLKMEFEAELREELKKQEIKIKVQEEMKSRSKQSTKTTTNDSKEQTNAGEGSAAMEENDGRSLRGGDSTALPNVEAYDSKDDELRQRLEQKLIKEQEEIRFKQLQREASKIQGRLDEQRRRMQELNPRNKKSSLFIQVAAESSSGRPTPAQKACVHRTRSVAVDRMTQSMTGELSERIVSDDARLMSPQFPDGSRIDPEEQWQQWQQLQQLHQLRQTMMRRQQETRDETTEVLDYTMTAVPLQTVSDKKATVFQNNIDQFG